MRLKPTEDLKIIPNLKSWNHTKFHEMLWILAIFFIFGIVLILAKKSRKCPNWKLWFLLSYLFVWKHLPTKFQKISLNGLNFNSFKLFFAKKRPENAEIKILGVYWILFCWRNYIPNLRKFNLTVWIFTIFFIFLNFNCFLAQNSQIRKLGSVRIFINLEVFTYQNFRKFN